MTSRRVVPVLFAAMGLAACGGASTSGSVPATSAASTSSATTSAAPASSSPVAGSTTATTPTSTARTSRGPAASTVSGARVSGTGYSLVVPDGFEQLTAPPNELGFVRAEEGRVRSFSVSVHDDGFVGLDGAAQVVLQTLKGKGAIGARTIAPMTVDGQEAIPVTSERYFNGVLARTATLVMIRDGRGYEVALISNQALTDAELVEEFRPFLDGWTWQG